jgi:glucose dehydrogenase
MYELVHKSKNDGEFDAMGICRNRRCAAVWCRIRAGAGDWATYGHDKGGQRHSPLREITPTNAAQLAPAWVYHMRPATPATTTDANADAQRRRRTS